MNEHLEHGLKELLESPIDPSLFPVKKGNKINIGSYSIVKRRDDYSIKDYKTETIVAHTYSKAAAIAIAKNLAKKHNKTEQILKLDREYSKHDIDCKFYQHIIKVTKDETQRDIVGTRFDISIFRADLVKQKIESYIL